MTRRTLRRSSLAPWTGLFVGAAAWFGHHQLGANTDYFACTAAGPALTVGAGIVALLVVGLGGWVSWRARAAPPSSVDRPETRSFAGAVGALSAAIFAFAIILQSLTGLVVPPCFR